MASSAVSGGKILILIKVVTYKANDLTDKNLDYSGESDDEPKTILMIGPPKSVSSIRDIPIPDFFIEKNEADCC